MVIYLKKEICFLSIKQFLNNVSIEGKVIFISKTKNAYLIGPLICENFDSFSFYKRIVSSSLYEKRIYKNVNFKKSMELFSKYCNCLSFGEIIELYKDGNVVKHNFFSLPGGENDE